MKHLLCSFEKFLCNRKIGAPAGFFFGFFFLLQFDMFSESKKLWGNNFLTPSRFSDLLEGIGMIYWFYWWLLWALLLILNCYVLFLIILISFWINRFNGVFGIQSFLLEYPRHIVLSFHSFITSKLIFQAISYYKFIKVKIVPLFWSFSSSPCSLNFAGIDAIPLHLPNHFLCRI